MKIAASLLGHLIDFAIYRGMNESALRDLTRFPGMEFQQEDLVVDADEYLSVLTCIADHEQDEHLGLSFGYFLNLNALGVVHTISLSTANIQQAFQLLEDFLINRFSLIELEKVQLGEVLEVRLISNVKEEKLHKFILDSTFCFIYRELSLMMNRDQVQLKLPYADLFPYCLKLADDIEKGNHTLSMHIENVNKTMNKKNLQMIEALLPQFLRMLNEGKRNKQSFSKQTKNMILNMSTPELPKLDQVSSQFAMSNRTFQRKLMEEGNSFRSIINEIRKELARYLQMDGKMKTQDVAFILGYADSSSFLHASKKWNE